MNNLSDNKCDRWDWGWRPGLCSSGHRAVSTALPAAQEMVQNEQGWRRQGRSLHIGPSLRTPSQVPAPLFPPPREGLCEWLYWVALLGVCNVHLCTTRWGLSPLPKSKTGRRGGRQEGERQEGLPGWPQYRAPLLSWLGLTATAECADPGWWEPRQQDWLIFIFFLDECEEVEHQCQKTIQQLETILGEPLQSYFWDSGLGYFILCSEVRLLFHIFILGVRDHVTFGALTLLGLLYKVPPGLCDHGSPSCQLCRAHKEQVTRGIFTQTAVFASALSMCVVCAQLLSLWDPLDCSSSGFSFHGMLQARILEWVAIFSCKGSPRPWGSNPGLLHCRWILWPINHWGSPSTDYSLFWLMLLSLHTCLMLAFKANLHLDCKAWVFVVKESFCMWCPCQAFQSK